MGSTFAELRDTLLTWLNAGKDKSLVRLRLTRSERTLLATLAERKSLPAGVLPARQAIWMTALVEKQLVYITFGSVYQLSSEGYHISQRR